MYTTAKKRSLMPIESIEDWETRLARVDAFWQCQLLDRPVCSLPIPGGDKRHPWPKKKIWPSVRDRWFDSEYQAELALASVRRTEYLGDALPTAFPNLGPEVFSAYFGTELEYGEETSWSVPNLEDWADVDQLRFSRSNPYFLKTMEMTDAFLEIGKNEFYTGVTDLHPGGDAIVAFRDPMNMNLDMVENVDQVKRLLVYINEVYFEVFDIFWDRLTEAGQVCTNWSNIVSRKKFYVPSNDFSCMISKRMFDEVFLPGIVEECRHLEASIYHLDGLGALRHLDSLLDIPELNAIQWVYGAGNGPATRWLHIYQKCQQAGKAIQIPGLSKQELGRVMEELRPEGVWLGFSDVVERDEAMGVLRALERWR